VKTIVVLKETKKFESRIGLIPADVKKLTDSGFEVLVESHSG